MKANLFLFIGIPLFFLASCSSRRIVWKESAIDSAEQKKYTVIKSIIGFQQYAEVLQTIPVESKTKVGFNINSKTNAYQVAHPDSGYSTIKILYGTDRTLVTNSNGSLSYGTDTTSVAGLYTVGYTIVTVPNTHVVGKEETPGFFRIFNRKSKKDFIVQQSIIPMNDDKFNKYLKENSSKYDAFIFVHGFNNSFEDAALRTAQLAADIKLPMAPIMYSWASNGSVLKYGKDSINNKRAIGPFIAFLKRVAINGQFTHIHLIAHSMGNRLIANALAQLYKTHDPVNLNIDEIVMAAPDIDTASFKAVSAKAIASRCQRVTVYSAWNDWALEISKHINHNYRLGEMGKPPFTIDGVNTVDVIDAQSIKTDFLGHDRFAQSAVILADMNKLFSEHEDPIARGVPHDLIDRLPYYYFVP